VIDGDDFIMGRDLVSVPRLMSGRERAAAKAALERHLFCRLEHRPGLQQLKGPTPQFSVMYQPDDSSLSAIGADIG
jgi:hypothetical protein